jgi:ubiquitin carboxyl-terminal hydrolase 8
MNSAASRGSWGGDRRPVSTGGSGGGRVLAHIEDIVNDARPHYSPDAQLSQMLSDAEQRFSASRTSMDFGRPDVAFKDYLFAYDTAVNCIRPHKDFGFWEYNQRQWHSRFRNLMRSLADVEPQMSAVRQQIKDNNERHETRRRSSSRQSVYDVSSSSPQANAEPANGSTQATQQSSPQSSSVLPPALRPGAPKPASKPEGLQGRPLSNGTNDLSERFARLRAPGSSSTDSSVLTMPSVHDFTQDHNTRPFSGIISSPSRPTGPRSMPNGANLPQVPPKVPIITNFSLPKAPDPTYSPINVTTPGVGKPHEGRPPREKRQTYYNQPQHGSNVSLSATKSRDDILMPYRPTTPNGVNSAIVPKSSSSDIPHDPMISPETLSTYMHRYNVLLVDIRERVAYDEGHILASSIICVEPLSLREGLSAEDLEDGLVLSPEIEQTLFARRNQFDVVVYYDQRTADVAYLKGPPTMTHAPALRAFYDTLYEFNDTKPLRDGRPPALLMGGIDAWADHMGAHSLAQSRTAAMLGTTRQRLAPGRPLTRQRVVSSNSRLDVRNRRLRAHSFLNEKEQKEWMQRAQQEEITPTPVDPHDLQDGEYITVEEESAPPSPFVSDVDSFLRRFPSVRDEQQSMMVAPRRPLTMPVPRHDVPPPLPQMPSVPSRPAPAVPRPSYSGQADIAQSQAPLARVTSGSRAPLYSSANLARTRKLPRTGLTNFGVTCYMNATIQCLSATVPLSQFFTDRIYEQYVQSNWKGSSGIMPKFYANLIQALWNDDCEGIKPSSFRKFCGRMNQEWIIDRQQDAKEFFDFLVDCLHEDLNVNWERTQLRALTDAEEEQRERMQIVKASPIEWQRFEHRDRSYVSSLFAGQHASRLRCLTCGKTSTTYEAFYSISIEIPRSGQGNIYDCLRSYTQEEKLSELWRCPNCKCEREATKQIILTRLPQFLVVHFKRFAASKFERAKKIHTPIEFPVYGLNMDDFVMCRRPPLPDKDGKYEFATTPPFMYDAYGVLRHLGGSLDSGHYISLVKDPGRGCWRKFDDERHMELDPQKLAPRDRLQNGEAYIVFFQRAPLR